MMLFYLNYYDSSNRYSFLTENTLLIKYNSTRLFEFNLQNIFDIKLSKPDK